MALLILQSPIPLQTLQLQHPQSVTVARLDQIHELVSGNKIFKLLGYIDAFKKSSYTTIATFGGAWSNHIVATAYYCYLSKIKCVGFIRGEYPSVLSNTLQLAFNYGMQLEFVDRSNYKNKDAIKQKYPNYFWINEGGYGPLGVHGFKTLRSLIPSFHLYDYIVSAVGTGTTLAGLSFITASQQQIIGISSQKNNLSLENETLALADPSKWSQIKLFHQYHFGGYAKHPPELIQYIKQVYSKHQLPLDIVYTSKAFFGLEDLLLQNYFPTNSKILFLHTGGLQGNASLPANTLSFL